MDNYNLFPTSANGLGYEIKRLVDSYNAKSISREELIQVLEEWQRNCEFMVKDDELSPSVVRQIGKRRATVVTKALRLGE